MSGTVPETAPLRVSDPAAVSLSSGAKNPPAPAGGWYRQIFEKSADALFVLDEAGFLDCNQAYLDLLGYTDKAQVLGGHLPAVSPPVQPDGSPSAQKAAQMIALACRSGSHRFEWLHRRADGADLLLEVLLTAMPLDGEQILHGTVRDATERRRFEDALHNAARGVSAATGDAFFRSLTLYLSRALRADYAFVAELAEAEQSRVRTTAVCVDGQIVPNFEYALPGTPCANVVSTVTGNDVCSYRSGVRGLFPDDYLLAEMGVDGYAGTPLFDSAGRVLGLLVVLFKQPVRDLPMVESMLQVFATRAAAELERRRAEAAREQALAALRQSEERFKSAFEHSSIGMALVSLDDRYLQVNQAACRLFGYSPEEMRELTTASVSHPEDLRELRKTTGNTDGLLSGEIASFQVEKRYRHKQGHHFWGLVGISLVRDAEGNPLHFISQVQDITERKQAEEALRRANEELEGRVRERTAELESKRALLEAVVRQMPAGVFIAEAPSGRLLLGNPQVARMLRVPPEEVGGGIEDLGRLTLWHPDGRPYAFEDLNIVRALRHGEVVENEEMIVLRGDGTRGALLTSSAPVRDDQGRIVAAVGTGLDITEMKQAGEALRRLHGELEMQVQERTAELAQANAALQEEVRERRRAEQVSRGQTQTLARTLNTLTARPDLGAFVAHLVEAIRDQLQADSLGVELYDAVQDRTVPRFSYIGDQLLTDDDLRDEWGVAPFLPASEDATWQAILQDPRPFAIYDVVGDPRLIYREQFLRSGVRSVLVVPMLLGEQPVGYLFINHEEPRRYEPREIELAQALAQQATLALQLESLAEQGRETAVLKERERLAREAGEQLARANAALEAEVRERRRAEQVSRGQTQALARTLGTLTAQPDVDTFLGHVLQAIREQLQADAFGVELHDAARDRLVPRFAYIGDQALSNDELAGMGVVPSPPAEHADWQTLLRERRPFASYDIANDPRLKHREVMVGLGVTSALVVPLLLGSDPIGFFTILNKHHRRYGPEEVELAQALAQQATLAVQFDRLTAQGQEAAVLKERERLARETRDALAQANVALQAEVQERRRAEQVSRGQTQALARTLGALTARIDVDTFLGHLFQAICEQLRADSVGVNLHDPARDHIVVRFASVGGQTLTVDDLRGWGVAPSLPALEETMWQAVLREGHPFAIYDVFRDPRMVYRDQYLRSGAQSVLVVPLLMEDCPVGYICIGHNRPHRYAPEETELALALAQQATLALQLSRLAEQGEEAAVLKERNRLAREIHDTLAQGFAGILIHLKLAEAALARKPEKALPALIQARDLAKDSLAEARRSVLALRPNALENESLPDALRKLVDVMTAGTPLRPRLEVLGAPCPLPAETENHLLRIGQEALNNTIKYAQASEVSVTLTFGEGRVTLAVRDNGAGFTPGERPRGGGFGHVGMRERIESLRGELTVHSAPGQGAEITAVVPIACGDERTSA